MTEKILARASGRASVQPGDEIEARPDFVISYDFPGYTDVFFKEAMGSAVGAEAIAAHEADVRSFCETSPRSRILTSAAYCVGVSCAWPIMSWKIAV